MIDPQFLAAVISSSDDNERLVYADWLEQNGDLARADLIRRQCVLARLPRWDRRWIEASWEADALLARHGARFRGELPVLDGVTWTEFERGFCSTVRVDSPATLYEHADAIAAAAPIHRVELGQLDESATGCPPGAVPWLRTLRLTRHDDGHTISPTASLVSVAREIEVDDIGEYQTLDFLTQRADDVPLSSLVIDGGHTAVGLGVARQLAGAPWSNALTRLELGTSFVDYDSGYFDDPTLRVEGARALADGKLVNLQLLDIDRQRVGSDGLRYLLSALPRLRELRARGVEASSLDFLAAITGEPIVHLDLGSNAIGDAGARMLARAPRLAALESLELDTCEISGKGIDALVRAPFWGMLRNLQLSRNPLGADGAVALFGGDPPPHLCVLRLADCDIESDAMTMLHAASGWLRDLLVLDLSRNDFGGDGIGFVPTLAGGGLRELNLARISLDSDHVGELAPVLPQLVHLDLASNPLDDDGVAALLATALPDLQSLNLAWCGLRDPRLDKLRAPKLRRLILRGNPLDHDAFERLLASPAIAALDTLELTGCKITADTIVANAGALAHLETLNLRGNSYDMAALLAIARSPELRSIHHLQLDGSPWDFEVAARDELAARFGAGWHYRYDDGTDDDDDGGDDDDE